MKELPDISQIKVHLFSLFKDKDNAVYSFLSAQKNNIIKLLIPFLILAFGYYICFDPQKTIQTDIQDIFTLSDDIRSFYADKPDYWGVSTESVIENKIVSPAFIRQNKLILSHGMEVLIGNGEQAEVVMPSSQNFDIILKNLTKAQCVSYAEVPIKEEQLLKLEKINIVNQQGTYSFEWGGDRKLPIRKDAANDICLSGNNTLIWTFK